MPVKKLHCSAQMQLLKQWMACSNTMEIAPNIFFFFGGGGGGGWGGGVAVDGNETTAPDHLEKLAESLLYNFYREHVLIKYKITLL